MKDTEQELIEEIARFDKDPVGWSRFAYPWGTGELSDSQGARDWQDDINSVIRDHLNSSDRFQPLLIAVSSGHGIGKSAEIGMVVNWAMSTCVDTRVIVTANTDTQLRTKTWPEISKWFRLAINAHWFNINATSVHSIDAQREKSWRADAIPWSENRTEAFAGLHNKGKRIIVVFDEGSAISDKIYEVTEGALTDENTEIIWIVFGNPTRNTGRFKACFGKNRHRWVTRRIDSREVDGTNKTQIARWAEDYGEDSDFFRVRVRGEFALQSSNQLITEESLDLCREFIAADHELFPIRITCDVARFGTDDTVIGVMQGRKLLEMIEMHGKDTVASFSKLAECYNHWRKKSDRIHIFIDDIGVGGGVTDMCRNAGLPVTGVNSGATDFPEKNVCLNLRMSMWRTMAQAIKDGLDLTAITQMQFEKLKDDLINIEYFSNPQNQKYQLESVDSLKARGLPSPDRGTAIALSFAYPVPNMVQSSVDRFKKAVPAVQSTLAKKRKK